MVFRLVTISTFLTVVVIFSATSSTQQQTPTCASSLVPCANYLNTTSRPSNECCTAITQVVQTQLPCLCNLFNNPAVFSSMGINSTQALGIPVRCGIPSDTTACNAPAPGSTNPGRFPGGNNGNGGSNGVGTISWSAMPALLFLWAATYLY